MSAAAGNAVLDYIEQENLFARVEPAGRELRDALEPLRKFSVVGDIRGMGLLFAIEFVRDAKTRAPFPPDARVSYRVQADALEDGVMTYPMQGTVDGTRGDHILIAPPYIIPRSKFRCSPARWATRSAIWRKPISPRGRLLCAKSSP